MLRASIEHAGDDATLAGIVGTPGRVLPHGDALVALADAAVDGDPARLATARDALAAATTFEFMVDAAAVVANFEMMTRVADTTGAAVDDRNRESTVDDRAALGADAFTTARWG